MSCENLLDYSLYPQIIHHAHNFLGSLNTKELSDAEVSFKKTWISRQLAHDGFFIQSAKDFVNVCQKLSSPKCKANKNSTHTVILV